MKNVKLYNVLITPIITEKSNTAAEKRQQVVFKVLKSSTKEDVKAAFELAFETKVQAVNLLNVKGKEKRFGRTIGRRDHWKKAYITLVPGQDFDFNAKV